MQDKAISIDAFYNNGMPGISFTTCENAAINATLEKVSFF